MIRIGLLVPSSNTVFENDFHAALPRPRFSVHAARMHLEETTPAAERAMIEHHAPAAADQLRTLHPDVVVFGCTSAGSLGGLEHDRQVCAALGERAGAPCLGVLSAVVEAIARRGWRKVVLVTSYAEALTATIAGSLTEAGLTVVASGGLGITNNVALADPAPEEIVAFAQSVVGGHRPDGLFISCTNFHALEAKPALEAALGLPVVTSNSAAIEAVLTLFPADRDVRRPAQPRILQSA
jgi:maleate isomerase